MFVEARLDTEVRSRTPNWQTDNKRGSVMAGSQNGRTLPAKPTIGDVAREPSFAVHGSGTLGGYGYVSESVRESVQAAAIKLGYRANAAAKTLKYGALEVSRHRFGYLRPVLCRGCTRYYRGGEARGL